MSTELMSTEELQSTELKRSLALYVGKNANGKWLQTTSILQAKRSGRSMLHYQAELPLDGSNKGYFVRIKDANGNIVKNTYAERTATSSPVSGTIQSDDLDLTRQNYVLEFGPHYQVTNVKSVAATVNLIQGKPRKFESSVVTVEDNEMKSVSFEYAVPPSIFDDNTQIKVYLVEGSSIKEEKYAIEGRVYSVSRSSYIGSGEISFNNALKHGNTYTLCMGIYSTVRQIASNTFIWE